jgi:transcription elongation GreA/GreB family factor
MKVFLIENLSLDSSRNHKKRNLFDIVWADGILRAVNKRELVVAVIEKLREDLALYEKAADAARAEATHEQSKAEHKYDTRGLEAAYLARGQSKQAAEILSAMAHFDKLLLRDFAPEEGIDMGAVVELQSGKETSTYFIGPRAGGTEIMNEKREVLVITPESPLGSQLIGRKAGEKCLLEVGGQKQQFKVTRVW